MGATRLPGSLLPGGGPQPFVGPEGTQGVASRRVGAGSLRACRRKRRPSRPAGRQRADGASAEVPAAIAGEAAHGADAPRGGGDELQGDCRCPALHGSASESHPFQG